PLGVPGARGGPMPAFSSSYPGFFTPRTSCVMRRQRAVHLEPHRMVARHQDILGPVLVVVPCLVIPYLNEEKHIERVVPRLLAEGDRLHLKIVIADGGSTDRTLEIARRLSKVDRRVVLMDDPKRIAAAMNDATRKYGDGAQFLIRIDTHASYPDRYCEHLLQVQARTRANSVMVTMHTEGRTCFQRAAAAAQNSMVGSGGRRIATRPAASRTSSCRLAGHLDCLPVCSRNSREPVQANP